MDKSIECGGISAISLLAVALFRMRLANIGVKNLGTFFVGVDALPVVDVEERRSPGVFGNDQASVVWGVRAKSSMPCSRSIRRRRRRGCPGDAVMIDTVL